MDVNLIDLTEGAIDITIEGTITPNAEWYCCGLGTAWEGEASYLDLNEFEYPLDDVTGDFKYTFELNEETADDIREYGRLWITGNGFNLNTVTISGHPIDEYDGMTATAESPVIVRANDPLDYENIIYTDHVYYWHTHYSEEIEAYQKGIGLLITETSIGGDVSDESIAVFDEWEQIWNSNNTGFLYWGIENGGDAALKTETVKRYGWIEEDYTQEGIFMYHLMRRAAGLE